jgi:hypothetical protein
VLLELCCLEEEVEGFHLPTLRVQAPLYRRGSGYSMSSGFPAARSPMAAALAWVPLSSVPLPSAGCFIKRLFPWTGIFGVYALGLPRILSWRRGLLGAVGGGHAWLASPRSPAFAVLVRTLQPLIKHRTKVSSSSPARAFGGEDVSR